MGKAAKTGAAAGSGDGPAAGDASYGRRVEVLVDNLGPGLLKKGTITSDPKIVALLDTARGRTLVREVNG
jgi:hypothetical protein